MKQKFKGRLAISAILLLLSVLLTLTGCSAEKIELSTLEITNCERAVLEIGDIILLETNAPGQLQSALEWSASGDAVMVDWVGRVTAVKVGKVAVTVRYGDLSDSVLLEIVEADSDDPDMPGTDPGTDLDELLISPQRDQFYGGSDPADSHEEAIERSLKGQISGALTVPDQAPAISADQPKQNGKLIRNNKPYYADENTYVVVDAYGMEVFRVYRGGGYITLEEVAAYVYAFGDVPANYVSDKNMEPYESIWGEYLRLNHSSFSGNTSKYPYEPELPRISGCGGDLYYYEIDIGTTGTDCDPEYSAHLYNNGDYIVRGAARIVYTRYDANRNNIIDPNEKYVFYTYNHYNDFQEYLNYYGGWGVMFGNITGGGSISSKYDCNPTPYVATVLAPLPKKARIVSIVYWAPRRDPIGAAA